MKKKILITGSCGLVGSELVNFFLKKKYIVLGIDNNLRKYFFGKNSSTIWIKKIISKNKNYRHFNIDIREINELEKIFKSNKNIKAIIHTAAQPSHDWAKKEPIVDFDINAKATLNLLELVRKYKKNLPFIFMSTNKVYGDSINNKKFIEKKYRYEISKNDEFFKYGVDEKFSIDQSKHSLFGVSKTSADLLVQEYGKYFNMKTVCFRCGCLTGPNHSGAELHGFLSYLVKCYVFNKEYKIFGYKGKQVRDNIHSNDLAHIIWEFIKKPKRGEVYNIGGGRKSNCSVLEAIKICEKIGKKKFRYKVLKNKRIGDHKWWISNNNKFKKHYPNWKQSYNIKNIIEELYSFYNK
tara:strand:+ start:3009 stop:4061 length:1053 start_codon:yes stop_codon:yes gene_type:complete